MSATGADATKLKPCGFSRKVLIELLEKHHDSVLYSNFFFKVKEGIPQGLEKHADIICLNGDLDCCRECGCTIAEHLPAAQQVVKPVPAVYREENYPLFFKKHLHESGIFRQSLCNHEMLDSASCPYDVRASHSFASKSHEMLVELCCHRGFTDIWQPVEDSNYKCSRSCMASHVYPHTGLSWVDNPNLPTNFLWLVPHVSPPNGCRELKNYHLWKAAASYIGYVLRYFGEAPDGTPLTVQESIQHHVRAAEAMLAEVSPSERSSVVRSLPSTSSTTKKPKSVKKGTPNVSSVASTSSTPPTSPEDQQRPEPSCLQF